MIVKCPSCKGDCELGAKACPHCGAPLRQSSQAWLWIVAVGAIAVLAVLVIVASPIGNTRIPPANEGGSQVMSREDFRSRIEGRTRDQAASNVGKPDSTSTAGKDMEFWYYHGRTKDTLTGKIDRTIQVVIRDGVVEDVNF